MIGDPLSLYRWARALRRRGLPLLPDLLQGLSAVAHGATIAEGARIRRGTTLSGGGAGVVIHREARVGAHCVIGNQVSIDVRPGAWGAPWIGDYVRIGEGARILGPVTVGAFAIIRPGTVVVSDVAPGTEVGVAPPVARHQTEILEMEPPPRSAQVAHPSPVPSARRIRGEERVRMAEAVNSVVESSTQQPL